MPSATAVAKSNRRQEPTPPPSLKRLGNVKTNAAPEKKTPSAIPVVKVEGDMMKRFNEAKEQMKDAEEVIKTLQPHIHQRAMEKIFEHNCNPDCLATIASVKLQDYTLDEEDESKEVLGEITRVSFTSRYNSCDTEQVDATFAAFKGRDINEYVCETLKAKFDDSVFLDSEGNFDERVYNKFRVAIEKVTKELGIKDESGNFKSPLSTKRVLIPKPEFHERRFKDFNEDENFRITQVLPNTISCTPQRTV